MPSMTIYRPTSSVISSTQPNLTNVSCRIKLSSLDVANSPQARIATFLLYRSGGLLKVVGGDAGIVSRVWVVDSRRR